MNFIKYISIPAVAVVLTLGSCANKLNIEPVDDISAEKALSTPSDVNNALTGAYTIIAKGALYGTNLVMVPDLYASPGYLNWTGTFSTYRDISNQNIISTNEDVTRTWTTAYQAINAANTVLEALPIITDEDMKSEIEGKALFIRGIMYFELVRLYGLPYEAGAANSSPGVPIALKAVTKFDDLIKGITRSSVADSYAQAEKDLLASISKLAEYPSDLAASKAMLARLYLQQGKYDKARDLANDIIESGDFELTATLEEPFRTPNSSEGVFEIQQSEQSNAGSSNDGLATFYSSYVNKTGGDVGRGDLSVLNSYYLSFDENDKRRTEMIYKGDGAKSGWFTRKWYNYFDNIPVVRLTDLYLMRAECNVRLGTAIGDTPLNDINTIRERAGLEDLTSVNITSVLAERDKELAFEGYRLHDLKRTKRNIGSMPYNSPKLVYPIPYREISVNSALTQNPGY